ncbi:TPA: AIDA repeat-containing protein [Escherichia albertii]|nr:AIDA repeat-containing protein [Escherichia albertii]
MNRNRPYIFRRTLLSLLIPSLIYSVQGRAYTQYVYDSVSDEFVTGQQTVRPGGTTTNNIIYSSGIQYVEGGAAIGSILQGGEQIVRQEGEVYGTIIENGGTQRVEFGGDNVSIDNTTINRGGTQVVGNTGSVVTNTHINSAGEQKVYGNGRAEKTDINGGKQTLEFSTAYDTTIQNGGMQSVFRESSAEKTTINAGGVQDVRETGSKAVDTIINSNGVQEIHDGGEALTTHIYGGAQYIDGGIADDTYIHSGTQNIDRGGKATNTYIYNGKQIVRERGTAINTTIHQGGEQEIYGTASNTNIYGTQYVNNGAIADITVINNGGKQLVKTGGKALNTTISSGGVLEVYDGAIANDVDQKSGGALITSTNSSISGKNSNGKSFSVNAGHADSVVLENSGLLTVKATGNATNTTIGSGGQMTVENRGAADKTAIQNGGVLKIDGGGTATGITQEAGGALIASTGTGVNVRGKNSTGDFVIDNLHAENAVLENTGTLTVIAGTYAENTTINNKGAMTVLGHADNTVINNGGSQEIKNGGQAVDTKISGGTQTINTGGYARTTTIDTGGMQIVKGGNSSNTYISGGSQKIEQNGIAYNTEIHSGAQIVYSGGVATDSTIFEDGIVEIQAGGSATGIKQNTNSVLIATTDAKQIDGLWNDDIHFSISGGKADHIVLENGGKLTVESGTSSADTLVGIGGTETVKTNATATGTTLNGGVQTVEGMADGTHVNMGGIQTVSSGGTATDAIVNGGTQTVEGTAHGTLVNAGGIQTVSAHGVADSSIIKSGAMLEVKANGTATNVEQSSGAALKTSTDKTINIIGRNEYGDFHISAGMADNLLLENGGSLSVLAATEAIDTTVGDGGIMQSLGNDRGTTVTTGGRYALGRSQDGETITFESLARAEDLDIVGGLATVYAGSLTGATVSGAKGSLVIMSPQDEVTPVTLAGAIQVSDQAHLTMGYGANTSAADLSVSRRGSAWLNSDKACSGSSNCAYTLNSLLLSDGDIYLSQAAASQSGTEDIYNTLTTNELSGSGNFYMHTDVASLRSDQLKVTGDATGNFNVFVANTGVSPKTGDPLMLVTTGGGDAAFTLGNTGGLVDLGTYEYALKSDGNHNWSLTSDLNPDPKPDPDPKPNPDPKPDPDPKPNPDPKPDPDPKPNPDPKPDPDPKPEPTPVPHEKRITPSTAAVLNMAATLPLVFDAELDSVRERLNLMRATGYSNNIWGTTYTTRNNVTTDAGAGFEQTLTGMTLGMDNRYAITEGVATLGVFVGYSHSKVAYDRGGHGNVDSYALGGYAAWEHESGFYLDSIVKLNRFESTVAGRMSGGESVNGSFNSNGFGGHVETGIRFTDGNWNLTPYVSLSGFTADNPEYRLSNGMEAKPGDTRSVYRELGATLSYTMRLRNGVEVEPWLKAAARKEFIDDNRVKVNNDGDFVNDLSGKRGVYQAGIKASFSNTLSGHLGISYGNGAGVESPWNAVAGMSWSF